ncbi:hypothetical protein GT043_01970, partial [Streptomyces sp. SID2131]|nr:hypothetical protein [Streptomyces sp. SID2131]
MTGFLRRLSWVLLPLEVVLVLCLVGGVRVPGVVLGVAEALVGSLLLAEGLVYLRLRRRGLSRREAVAELVPGPVLRLLGHELRLLASLGRWVARRPHGTAGADG